MWVEGYGPVPPLLLRHCVFAPSLSLGVGFFWIFIVVCVVLLCWFVGLMCSLSLLDLVLVIVCIVASNGLPYVLLFFLSLSTADRLLSSLSLLRPGSYVLVPML